MCNKDGFLYILICQQRYQSINFVPPRIPCMASSPFLPQFSCQKTRACRITYVHNVAINTAQAYVPTYVWSISMLLDQQLLPANKSLWLSSCYSWTKTCLELTLFIVRAFYAYARLNRFVYFSSSFYVRRYVCMLNCPFMACVIGLYLLQYGFTDCHLTLPAA